MIKPSLPALPTLPTLGAKPPPLVMAAPPVMRTLDEIAAANINPLDVNNDKYTGDAEADVLMDLEVIEDEFAAIHAARKQQADAIDLANDSEFWFCMFFQTREQKEAFVRHFGLPTDKYIDGQDAAARMGVTLPPREAKYKVGRIDKKLADLT